MEPRFSTQAYSTFAKALRFLGPVPSRQGCAFKDCAITVRDNFVRGVTGVGLNGLLALCCLFSRCPPPSGPF